MSGAYKIYYSYKQLPYLPSPSSSPPPIQILDSVDELSELEYNDYQSDNSPSRRNSFSSAYPHPNGKFKRVRYASKIFVTSASSSSSGSGNDTTEFSTEFYDTEDDQKREILDDIVEISVTSNSLKSFTRLNEMDLTVLLCDSLENCTSMHHIIDNLKLYQMIETDKIDDIEFINKLNENILDDYHHILVEHLSNKSVDEINEEFNNLHGMLRKEGIRCDFGKCSSIRRYHRVRENIDNLEQQSLRTPDLQFFVDLMDTIHCYFIHSFDLGMRIKLNKYYDRDEDEEDDNKYAELEYHDQEIKIIKRRLNQLNITRNRTKFFTKFENAQKNNTKRM